MASQDTLVRDALLQTSSCSLAGIVSKKASDLCAGQSAAVGHKQAHGEYRKKGGVRRKSLHGSH